MRCSPLSWYQLVYYPFYLGTTENASKTKTIQVYYYRKHDFFIVLISWCI